MKRRHAGFTLLCDYRYEEIFMAPNDIVNLATALLALAAVIVLFRLFRGDIGDNKGGLTAAVVLLGGLAYGVRTEYGRRLVDYLLGILG